MKPVHYYDECWLQNFWFFIGWKPELFESWIKKEWDYTPDLLDNVGKTLEATHFDGGSVIVIWTREKRGPKFYETLGHEAVHAAMFCLANKGVKVTPDNDEPLAYLVGVIMRKAMA